MHLTRTASQRLADVLLGEPVEQWIAAQRADDRSWPWIVRQLNTVTNGQVNVSRTTVIAWASQADVQDVAA